MAGGYKPGTYSVGGNISNVLDDKGTAGKVGASFFTPHRIAEIWGGDKSMPPMLLGPGISTNADLARQRKLSRMYGQEMDQDLLKGYGMSQELVPQEAFGRINEQPYAAKLSGYTGPENQALRDKASRENMRGYATARENLARSQAYSGVRGPTASYQAAKLGKDFNRANIESNQNLMIGNIAEKNRALDAYSGIQKYNQGQGRDELGARLGVQFGYGQMGSANRAGAAQYFANKDAMDMQKQMFNMQQMNAANAPKGGK